MSDSKLREETRLADCTILQRRVLEILRDYGPCTGAEIGRRVGHRVGGGTLRGRGLRFLIREETHVTNRVEWHITDVGRAALAKEGTGDATVTRAVPTPPGTAIRQR